MEARAPLPMTAGTNFEVKGTVHSANENKKAFNKGKGDRNDARPKCLHVQEGAGKDTLSSLPRCPKSLLRLHWLRVQRLDRSLCP